MYLRARDLRSRPARNKIPRDAAQLLPAILKRAGSSAARCKSPRILLASRFVFRKAGSRLAPRFVRSGLERGGIEFILNLKMQIFLSSPRLRRSVGREIFNAGRAVVRFRVNPISPRFNLKYFCAVANIGWTFHSNGL